MNFKGGQGRSSIFDWHVDGKVAGIAAKSAGEGPGRAHHEKDESREIIEKLRAEV